jgi:hypothetical protein
MKITRESFKNIVREVMIDESEYQTFFAKALEKTGKSIPDMSDEEKKAFFNKIDSAWDAKGEKNEELTGNQHKLDVDGDGEIEASDLAALRAGKTVNEAPIPIKDGKYHFYYKDGVGYLEFNGKKISSGDYDMEDGSNSYWMSHSSFKGSQKAFNTGKDIVNYFKSKKITTESVNEAGGTVKNPKTGKDIKISTALSYGKSHPAYKAAATAAQQARPAGGAPGVKTPPPTKSAPPVGTAVSGKPAPTNAKPAIGTKVTSAPPKNAQPPVGTKVTGPPPGVNAKPPVKLPPAVQPKSAAPPTGGKPPDRKSVV